MVGMNSCRQEKGKEESLSAKSALVMAYVTQPPEEMADSYQRSKIKRRIFPRRKSLESSFVGRL